MIFLEFNKGLPGAPTKVRSEGVTGYVTLPELSEAVSEFTDMVGGILQSFRGDWAAAAASFERVVQNPSTRTPLRLDALLYLGMATFRKGGDGMDVFLHALQVAPFDRSVVQYSIVGLLQRGREVDWKAARDLLARKRHLFAKDDPWLLSADMVFDVDRE